jgi:hypothetical protein
MASPRRYSFAVINLRPGVHALLLRHRGRGEMDGGVDDKRTWKSCRMRAPRFVRRLLPLFVAFLAFAVATPARADLDAGIRAYSTGDYVVALREFRAAAEQGNPLARYNLGQMYFEGRGVTRDDAEARFGGSARLPTRASLPPSTTSA